MLTMFQEAPGTRIIAEACANHLGDARIQEEMIWAAAEAGADTIKFQSWQSATNTRGQTAQMAPFELSDDDHYRLMSVAAKARIRFSTTVFDVARVPFVKSLNLDFVKVASPDCGSRKLLDALCPGTPKVIISTGMSTDDEVEATAEMVNAHGCDLALLHCIYPLADGVFNLSRIESLRRYASEVGLSDHSAGADLRASMMAITMGAEWIERHFILDRSMKAKDSAVSIEPSELKRLVDAAKSPPSIDEMLEQHPELMAEPVELLSAKVMEFRDFYRGRWGDNR